MQRQNWNCHCPEYIHLIKEQEETMSKLNYNVLDLEFHQVEL